MPTKIKGHLVYILLHEQQIIGTWSNLKHLCDDVKKDKEFISYSKLSKEIAAIRRDGIEVDCLDFTTREGEKYTIKIEKLR
jgi:hypothetical protein